MNHSLTQVLLHSAWSILLQLAPWLLLGSLIAGILHVVLPTGSVRGHLKGRLGVFKAVLFGVPLPLCSCGVIPAGIGLKRDGASNGAAMGFLISTPQTGVDSILVSSSFLGWPFALFKVAAAAVTGVVGGLLADGVDTSGREEAEPTTEGEHDRSVRELFAHAIDILRSVWLWLVFGIVVSTLIDVLVPDRVLVGLGELGTIGAGLVALVISLPLYVCATASVPIAATLVAGGMPAGAALVFLMAGPATNVATLGAVMRSFGTRILGIYLGTIIVGSLAGAWVFETLIDATSVRSALEHHHAGPVATVCALALLALLAWFALADARAAWRHRRLAASSEERQEIAIEGMTCGNCAAKVEAALIGTKGVNAAQVTHDPGLAIVTGQASREQLAEVIRASGYSASA